MLNSAVNGIKHALTELINPKGKLIFSDHRDIFTSYPHPGLFKNREDVIAEGRPLVALYLTGKAGEMHRSFMGRFDVTNSKGQDVRRDVYSYGDLSLSCEIHILVVDDNELVGIHEPRWPGYIDQVLAIVATHYSIVHEYNTMISWMWDGNIIDVPVPVEFADRPLYLGMVHTSLTGKIAGEEVDGARITDIQPEDYEEIVP